MKLRSKISAIAFGIGLLASATASAATIGDLGTLGTSPKFFVDSVSGSFSDQWLFSVGTDSTLGATAVVLNFNVFNFSILNIDPTSFSVSIIDPTNTTTLATASRVGTGLSWTLDSSLAAGSNYILNVSGTADGAFGGAFGGIISAVPVPEPSTYAMLLAGLGMLGFAARRRMS